MLFLQKLFVSFSSFTLWNLNTAQWSKINQHCSIKIQWLKRWQFCHFFLKPKAFSKYFKRPQKSKIEKVRQNQRRCDPLSRPSLENWYNFSKLSAYKWTYIAIWISVNCREINRNTTQTLYFTDKRTWNKS